MGAAGVAECGDEGSELAVALHSTELNGGDAHPGGRPARAHVAVLSALDLRAWAHTISIIDTTGWCSSPFQQRAGALSSRAPLWGIGCQGAMDAPKPAGPELPPISGSWRDFMRRVQLRA